MTKRALLFLALATVAACADSTAPQACFKRGDVIGKVTIFYPDSSVVVPIHADHDFCLRSSR